MPGLVLPVVLQDQTRNRFVVTAMDEWRTLPLVGTANAKTAPITELSPDHYLIEVKPFE
jgi:hypothetical protein